MPGVLTFCGAEYEFPSLPAATAATIPVVNRFSNTVRMDIFVETSGFAHPKDMLKTSAPFSAANSTPEINASSVPRPLSLRTFIHISVASGAMPVCVPEVPSPHIVPEQ